MLTSPSPVCPAEVGRQVREDIGCKKDWGGQTRTDSENKSDRESITLPLGVKKEV